MNKGGEQGEETCSLCIFRSICASSGPELWVLPHQMCWIQQQTTQSLFHCKGFVLFSVLCPHREGGEQQPACCASCGALLQQLGSRCPMKCKTHSLLLVLCLQLVLCLLLILFHSWCELIKMKEEGWRECKAALIF